MLKFLSNVSVRDNLSESEAEEVEGQVTVLQDRLGHEGSSSQQSAVKLMEVRITLSSLSLSPTFLPPSPVGTEDDTAAGEGGGRDVCRGGTAPPV